MGAEKIVRDVETESGPGIKKVELVTSLVGYLLPWDIINDAPVFLSLQGDSLTYMPLFKSSSRLHNTMTRLLSGRFYKVKIVEDESFIDAMLEDGGVVIALDAMFLENGTVKFIEMT
jgi:hypothetical protein